MFSTPVTISNRMPPTSISREIRSITWATDRAGGQANNRGMTDHSLPSTTGMMINPSPTCRPWVSRYNHDGVLGQLNTGRRSHPTSAGIAWFSCGA